jgi:hypothetical protein
MVSLNNNNSAPQPTVDEPITSLNLVVGNRLEDWPELQPEWEELAEQVAAFVREAPIEALEKTEAAALLNSAMSNVVVLKTVYLGKSSRAEEGTLDDGPSLLESKTLERGNEKIAALRDFVEKHALLEELSFSREELASLNAITEKIASLHAVARRSIEEISE